MSSGRSPPRIEPVARWLAWLALSSTAACGGDAVVTLGTGGPVPVFGDAGQRVRSLNLQASEDRDAVFSDDLLEAYYTSDRADGGGGGDIWHAERSSRTDAFDRAFILPAVNSVAEESSPVIAPDGLTLWFGSRREGGLGGMDVWRSTRAARGDPWGEPQNEVALNSPFDDEPRPLGEGGSVMPLVSDRDGVGRQTYLAHWRSPDAALDAIEPLDYLWQPGAIMDDPFLTWDGLLLFFKRAAEGGAPGDLFVAWRTTTHEPFREPAVLPVVNSDSDEADPFLSSDQIRFFFSSDRRDGETLDIYATSIILPPLE
jgi:WD40 repeat protein